MASGLGLTGGRGRCYSFWVNFTECMSQAVDTRECVAFKEDYVECLHHKREFTRLNMIYKEHQKQLAEKAANAGANLDKHG